VASSARHRRSLSRRAQRATGSVPESGGRGLGTLPGLMAKGRRGTARHRPRSWHVRRIAATAPSRATRLRPDLQGVGSLPLRSDAAGCSRRGSVPGRVQAEQGGRQQDFGLVLAEQQRRCRLVGAKQHHAVDLGDSGGAGGGVSGADRGRERAVGSQQHHPVAGGVLVLRGRPKRVASQAPDLAKRENSLTPFDCPRDRCAPPPGGRRACRGRSCASAGHRAVGRAAGRPGRSRSRRQPGSWPRRRRSGLAGAVFPHGEQAAGEDGGHDEGGDGDPPPRPPPGWALGGSPRSWRGPARAGAWGEFAGPFGQGPAAAAGLDLTPAVLACQQVCFEPVTVAPWELAAEVGGGGPLRVMAHGGLPAVRGPLGPAPCGRGAPRPARSPGGSQGSRRLRRR
jgi:hypothetical protein